MASPFESFIQTELPKRGYLNDDVPQETIIVRRGMGPRQFDAVTLEEGQVLAYVNGQLAGVNVSVVGGGVRKAVLTVTQPTETWELAHNLNSKDVIIQAFDPDGFVIIPDTMQVVDENNVRITFNSALLGVARIIFLD